MKYKLIALGQRMPSWINSGFSEYAKRLYQPLGFELLELPLQKRRKSQLEKILQRESQQILQQLPPHSHVVALDVKGKPWSTSQLSQQLAQWQLAGKDVYFIIGGPEGLSTEVLTRVNQRWSLSALTLPHPLVRVLTVEALYRAWTLHTGHPYHRN